MIHNIGRIGNFTSSEIVALTTSGKDKSEFGKPALTYIYETNMEREFGRSISTESNAKPLGWGKMGEKIVFNKLGIEYIICNDQTIYHPEIDYWTGSPDAIKEVDKIRTVSDAKCPQTHKSFYQLVKPLMAGYDGMGAMDCIRFGWVDDRGFKHPPHNDGEKFYWQLISNACISKSTMAELIVWMPYFSDLPMIREAASNYDGNQNAMYWINRATDDELPYLLDDGKYKDINQIVFPVDENDKDFLTERVKKGGKYLIPFPL